MFRGKRNIMLYSDAYKFCHHLQYLPGTDRVYSYLESRKGATFPYTVFYGLQHILHGLSGEVVTEAKCLQAGKFIERYFRDSGDVWNPMWTRILKKHGGYLPLRIKAVPEGTPVPIDNVMMTVENTDPECGPLTNYVETLLTHVWYPSTVATLARETKRMIAAYWSMYGSPPELLDTMLWDFGFRGCTCPEQAEVGGSSALVMFNGTDTVPGILHAMEHYGAEVEDFAPGVPATEHSVMTAGGPEGESLVLAHILDQHPTGILSIVGDSYNIFAFARDLVSNAFRTQIVNRDGLFVLRPDSGDPVKTVMTLLDILGKGFGITENSKGYRLIDGPVRILWGDGLTPPVISNILGAMVSARWAPENIATFGMGGGLLQKVNRDTQRTAFKCSAQQREGQWYDIYKDPVDKSKTSKRGRLKLARDVRTGHLGTYRFDHKTRVGEDLMQTVFENGKVVKSYTWADVKQNAKL